VSAVPAAPTSLTAASTSNAAAAAPEAGAARPADPDSAGHRTDERHGALSEVPAAGSRRGLPLRGMVKFFHGPMDCGKSTLALQMDHNFTRQGRHGLLLTKLDRSRPGVISSRMGLLRPAVEVADDMDLITVVRQRWSEGARVDYVIVDEAQFFTPDQVGQLCRIADESQVDVYGFGISTDFRGRLFPGSARWFELADEVQLLQVEVLCWCGRPGRFNARVVNGVVARTGSTVLVADTQEGAETVHTADRVRYQVLCRSHHRSGELGPVTSRPD
jgi:thymidine kinase